jgi:hypothetical protein
VIVNVHMADGKTVFQFPSRKSLQRALGHEPGDEGNEQAFIRTNVTDGWVPVRAAYIRKHSVAFVVAAEDVAANESVEDELPAKAMADERARQWREREGVE